MKAIILGTLEVQVMDRSIGKYSLRPLQAPQQQSREPSRKGDLNSWGLPDLKTNSPGTQRQRAIDYQSYHLCRLLF